MKISGKLIVVAGNVQNVKKHGAFGSKNLEEKVREFLLNFCLNI